GIGRFPRRRRGHAGGVFLNRAERVVSAVVLRAGVVACVGSRICLARSAFMKIGFLAMGGIRAHDPELLRLGLPLRGVVERSQVVASLPSLGLLYLAAATPPGHELRDFEAESDGSEPPEVYTCDLVAISTFSAQVAEAYAIADRLRRAGVKVAMGGLDVSVRPEEARQQAGLGFIGEGGNVWLDHLKDLGRGNAKRRDPATGHP